MSDAPATPQTDPAARRKKIVTIVGLAVVALIVLAGVGLWWFFKDDAPEAVSLDQAVSGVEAESDSSAGPVEIDGTWNVDTSIGSFDFESASGSFVGFRIEEELSTIGSTTAVGRTGEVEGTLLIEDGVLTTTAISADMTSITTNDSRRDSRARSAVNAGEFPAATFVLGAPIDLGSAAADGSPVSVTAVGALTIAGVTNEVEFAIDAQLTGDVIVVVGSTEVVFDDFGVEVPAAPIILSVDDHGVVEFQLLFSRA